MSNALVTADECADVRAAIDVTLPATALPDTTILLAVFADKAARDITARVTNGEDIVDAGSGDDFETMRLAAIYYTAALIMPALPQLISESVGQGDFAYRMAVVDPLKRQAQLFGLASTEVATLNGSTGMPTFFTLAPGGRAQGRTSARLVPDGTIVLG